MIATWALPPRSLDGGGRGVRADEPSLALWKLGMGGWEALYYSLWEYSSLFSEDSGCPPTQDSHQRKQGTQSTSFLGGFLGRTKGQSACFPLGRKGQPLVCWAWWLGLTRSLPRHALQTHMERRGGQALLGAGVLLSIFWSKDSRSQIYE